MSEKFQELRGRLPLSEIEVDLTFNARKLHDSGTESQRIDELAKSIEESGLLNDVLVRDHGEEHPGPRRYSLVHGFRRYEACRRLGWEKIPCKVRRYESDAQAELDNLAENVQREDLRPYDFARRVQDLHRRRGLSYDAIAKQLGTDAQWVLLQVRCLERFPLDLIEAFRAADRSLTSVFLRVVQEPTQDAMRRTYETLLNRRAGAAKRSAAKEGVGKPRRRSAALRKFDAIQEARRSVVNGELSVYQGRQLSDRERMLVAEVMAWVMTRQDMPLERDQ